MNQTVVTDIAVQTIASNIGDTWRELLFRYSTYATVERDWETYDITHRNKTCWQYNIGTLDSTCVPTIILLNTTNNRREFVSRLSFCRTEAENFVFRLVVSKKYDLDTNDSISWDYPNFFFDKAFYVFDYDYKIKHLSFGDGGAVKKFGVVWYYDVKAPEYITCREHRVTHSYIVPLTHTMYISEANAAKQFIEFSDII